MFSKKNAKDNIIIALTNKYYNADNWKVLK